MWSISSYCDRRYISLSCSWASLMDKNGSSSTLLIKSIEVVMWLRQLHQRSQIPYQYQLMPSHSHPTNDCANRMLSLIQTRHSLQSVHLVHAEFSYSYLYTLTLTYSNHLLLSISFTWNLPCQSPTTTRPREPKLKNLGLNLNPTISVAKLPSLISVTYELPLKPKAPTLK